MHERRRGKVRVAVLFGGQSSEHDVSLRSAETVMGALDPDRYEVIPVGITREGRWVLTSADEPPMEPMTDDDLLRAKEYRLFSGAAGTSPMWQMVQHVVNHASYHRGQVTTMLRQAGARPPKSVDLITFYRETARIE